MYLFIPLGTSLLDILHIYKFHFLTYLLTAGVCVTDNLRSADCFRTDFVAAAVMDRTQNETELQSTERFERLTVTNEKAVIDESGQDARALVDNSCDADLDGKDGNVSSELLVIENSQTAVDGLTLDSANCIPDCDGFSAAENVAEILPASVSGDCGETAVDSVEFTSEQGTSSLVDSSMKDVSELDLAVAADGRTDHVEASYVTLLTNVETTSPDNAAVMHDELSLSVNSAKEPAVVSDVLASAADVNLASAVSLLRESRSDQTTEAAMLSGSDSSQPEATAEGKCVFPYFLRH